MFSGFAYQGGSAPTRFGIRRRRVQWPPLTAASPSGSLRHSQAAHRPRAPAHSSPLSTPSPHSRSRAAQPGSSRQQERTSTASHGGAAAAETASTERRTPPSRASGRSPASASRRAGRNGGSDPSARSGTKERWRPTLSLDISTSSPASTRSPRLRTKRDQLSMSVQALKQAQRSLGEVERDHEALAGNVARREEELVAQRERIAQLTAIAKQLLDQLLDKEHGGELAALAREEMQDSISHPVNAFFDGQDQLSRFIERRVGELEALTSQEAQGGREEGEEEAGKAATPRDAVREGMDQAELKALGWPGGEDDEEDNSGNIAKAASALRLPSDRELDALFPVEHLTL